MKLNCYANPMLLAEFRVFVRSGKENFEHL